MANKLTRAVLLAVVALVTLSFMVPKGWHPSGNADDKYEIGVWKVGGHNGSKTCGVIRSSKKTYFKEEYGSLMQAFSSQRYLGKRIRMTAFMKTRGVENWAGFYLRADREDSKEPITFDNMYDRPIKGTTDWHEYKIELDIPLSASKIAFGALLHGAGQVWVDDVSFEVIGNSTITATEVKCDTSLKREPENLDFESL